MGWRIGKDVTIHAAHRLDKMPEGHQCRNLHGHSYRITVELESGEVDGAGMLIDFGLISDLIKAFDHQYLNDLFPEGMPTTAEMFALVIGQQLVQSVLAPMNADEPPERHIKLVGVTVRETDSSYARWTP